MIASVLLTYQPPDNISSSNDNYSFQIQSCAAKHMYNQTALICYVLRNLRQAISDPKQPHATTYHQQPKQGRHLSGKTLERKESTPAQNTTDDTEPPSGENPHGSEVERIHTRAKPKSGRDDDKVAVVM